MDFGSTDLPARHELQVIPALLVAVPDENTGHFLARPVA